MENVDKILKTYYNHYEEEFEEWIKYQAYMDMKGW